MNKYIRVTASKLPNLLVKDITKNKDTGNKTIEYVPT